MCRDPSLEDVEIVLTSSAYVHTAY